MLTKMFGKNSMISLFVFFVFVICTFPAKAEDTPEDVPHSVEEKAEQMAAKTHKLGTCSVYKLGSSVVFR